MWLKNLDDKLEISDDFTNQWDFAQSRVARNFENFWTKNRIFRQKFSFQKTTF